MRLAVDLGSTNIRIVDAGKGAVLTEPALVALNSQNQRIIGVGTTAQRMVGRTAPHILQIHPLRDGVIAHHDLTTAMLRHFMRRVSPWWRFIRPQVVMSISARSTTVEKRALQEAAIRAGARNLQLIDAPMAAAIGAGLDTESPFANLIVHVGSGGTDIAVIAMGRIVLHEVSEVGGDEFDRAIAHFLEQKHPVIVENDVAEDLKVRLGRRAENSDSTPTEYEVVGRDPESGLPRPFTVDDDDVQEALRPALSQLGDTLRSVLERTSPELATDIAERGAVLTGGGALLPGIDRFLATVTGLPVRVAHDPANCVLIGTTRARVNSSNDGNRGRRSTESWR